MGLTEEQITIIKATVPILETGGETLTKHFYGIMLTEYPEVVPFFNKTHQASGDQPRALAKSVLMYAKNIDRLHNLGPVASQIINKHVSLNVLAEHYPIVGACLLRAIREVLGEEIASDAVIAAWAAAYQQLADILIAAEEKIYSETAVKVGGWRGDRSFVLEKKVVETPLITSFYFAPEDKQAILPYIAGQYTCVHITDASGQDIRRNYSLSQVHEENTALYRISVKREEHGLMSNYLHALSVGDKVNMLPPAGEFIYQHIATENTTENNNNSDKPLVLVAGGVGITPIYTMLQAALTAEPTRDISLIYCSFSAETQAFLSDLTLLSEKYPTTFHLHHWYSSVQGRRMNKDDLFTFLPKHNTTSSEINLNMEVFFTAPKQMMRDLKHYFVEDFNLPEANVHYEFFGPKADI